MSNTAPLRIVFFGDSICVGQGVSLYKGWVTRIAQELDELGVRHNQEIEVVNSSINGRITRQALEDMPYHVQSGGVDVLVIQFGMNDCNYWETDRGLPRVSPKSFSANIEEIIERGRQFGAQKIILNTNHPTSQTTKIFPHTNLTYEDSNKNYNNILRELASRLGDKIIFNDVESFFENHLSVKTDISDFLLADQLHLSLKGHALYYNYLSPVLNEAVSNILLGKSGGSGEKQDNKG